MFLLRLVHTIRFLLKLKKFTEVKHFYELKQCQLEKRIRKYDRASQPLES